MGHDAPRIPILSVLFDMYFDDLSDEVSSTKSAITDQREGVVVMVADDVLLHALSSHKIQKLLNCASRCEGRRDSSWCVDKKSSHVTYDTLDAHGILA